MKCPVCTDENLLMTDRQGVEIDYCPKCRGVWLDRGELDKIIERATPAPAQAPKYNQAPEQPRMPPHSKDHYKDHHKDHYKHSGGYGYPKKKSSLLGELFDF